MSAAKLPAGVRNLRSLDSLVPMFREAVERVLRACLARGIEMVPYETVIGPAREAELWARSRTIEQVQAARRQMVRLGAPRLAALLRDELAQRGPWASNALPGRSWHGRGEAVDCYWQVGGRGVWSGRGYEVWAEEARRAGLTAGHYWARLRDSVHVQLRPGGGTPEAWPEVERIAIERFEI